MKNKRNSKRVLIVRTDRIGDLVLSTPAVKAVRDALPDAYIACMVDPGTKELVDGNPYIDEVIVCDKSAGESGVFGVWRLARRIASGKFDCAVILHPTLRVHSAVFLAGIPVRVGYDVKGGVLLTKRVPHTKQLGLKHEIDYNIDMLRYAGIEPASRALHVPVHKRSEAKTEALLAEHGAPRARGFIVISPGASCPSKRWDPARFGRAADMLASRYDARVVIIGSVHDRMLARSVAGAMKANPIDLTGALTVGDIASVLKRSRILISNDSGPVHIACALGTPVISIFGRADRGLSPRRWGPSGIAGRVLHKDVGCDRCMAHRCVRAFKCLGAITVEDVVNEAVLLLKSVVPS